MKFIEAITVAAIAFSLAACSSKDTKPDDTTPAPITEDSSTTTSGIDSGSASTVGSGTLTPEQQAMAALEARSVVYFEYDSSEIKPEYVPVVAAHAAFLAKYPAARVRLEGHTDERGSREYNIGLGERRAQVVQQALILQGAKQTQVVTVSYGEERPAVAGSDEAAYAQNRRVQLVYAR